MRLQNRLAFFAGTRQIRASSLRWCWRVTQGSIAIARLVLNVPRSSRMTPWQTQFLLTASFRCGEARLPNQRGPLKATSDAIHCFSSSGTSLSHCQFLDTNRLLVAAPRRQQAVQHIVRRLTGRVQENGPISLDR
jgi:hypothetical protein